MPGLSRFRWGGGKHSQVNMVEEFENVEVKVRVGLREELSEKLGMRNTQDFGRINGLERSASKIFLQGYLLSRSKKGSLSKTWVAWCKGCDGGSLSGCDNYSNGREYWWNTYKAWSKVSLLSYMERTRGDGWKTHHQSSWSNHHTGQYIECVWGGTRGWYLQIFMEFENTSKGSLLPLAGVP